MRLTRRRVIALVAAASLFVIGGLIVFCGPSSSISDASRIRKGMTRSEVELILGRPFFEHPGSGKPVYATGWFCHDGVILIAYHNEPPVAYIISVEKDHHWYDSIVRRIRWRLEF